MKLYFAYGANLNQANMAWRCADAVAVQPFYLQDWRLAFSAVATVQPCKGDRVPGALWAISDQDEAALDRFEAWPSLYRKETTQQDLPAGFQTSCGDAPYDSPRAAPACAWAWPRARAWRFSTLM